MHVRVRADALTLFWSQGHRGPAVQGRSVHVQAVSVWYAALSSQQSHLHSQGNACSQALLQGSFNLCQAGVVEFWLAA